MNQIFNHAPTHELQARDAAHHMHPFTAQGQLAEKGARVIKRRMAYSFTTVMVRKSWTRWRGYGALTLAMVEKSLPMWRIVR